LEVGGRKKTKEKKDKEKKVKKEKEKKVKAALHNNSKKQW
jgi:hypothetical protein